MTRCTRLQAFITHPIFIKICYAQFFLAIAIYIGLLLAPSPPTPGLSINDKFLHAVGNALLVLSLWVAWGRRIKLKWLFVFAVGFSALMEVAQSFTAQRSAELLDLAANTVGATLGLSIALALSAAYASLENEQNSQ